MSRRNAPKGKRAAGPEIRPSRAEREPYTNALAESLADGRLTDALFDERLAAADTAPSFSELDALVADLPYDPEELRPPHARLRVPVPGAPARRGGGRPGAGIGVPRIAVPVLFAVGFLGSSIAWAAVDHGENSGVPSFSTQAGSQVRAPDDLPRLDTAFTAVEPLEAETFAQAVKFIEDNDLGFVAEISTMGESTHVFTVNAAQKVHFYTLSPDRAPTADSNSGVYAPIANVRAAAELDVRDVLRRARSDLGTDAEVSQISVGTQLADFRKQRYTDIVTASFSGDNAEGQDTIVYRLRDMKILEKD